MTLGCILIFLCVLALFRKRMRAKRAKRTAKFAAKKNIDGRGVGWRERLGFLFSRGQRIPKEDKDALRVAQLRNREEERHMAALNKLGVSPSASGSVRGGGSEADTESLYSQVTGLPSRAPVPRQPVKTEAQLYAKSVEDGDGDTPWLVPAGTGTTQASRNPFRPK